MLWALAAVLHLLAVGPAGPAWAQAGLAVSAGLAIAWPGAVGPLALLAASGLATAWYEAPGGPETWVLVAIVDAGILLCVAVGAVRGRAWDRVDLAERVFPSARLSLVLAHAFAGFAKLNDGYLDRRVSCGVVRFREATSSMGLEALQLGGTAWLERVVIVGTIAVELAIPVLLLVRRTRIAGVLLAVGFHGLVGLDRPAALWASSAVAIALLSLFLPAAGPWAAERVGSVRARLALRGPRLPVWLRGLAAAVPALLGLLVAADLLTRATSRTIGWRAWQLALVGLVAALARLLRHRASRPPATLRPHHALFLAIPLVVVLNGLSPYLGVRTAGTWTAWSNLRTVAGDTNHLLAGTADRAGPDGDLVRVVDSDDPVLARYRTRAVGLTWRELRGYLSQHPDVGITYVRDGRRVSVAAAQERPELVEPVPTWRAKVLAFRPVDLLEPQRCLSDPGPGRT